MIRIGTRESALAIAQAIEVKNRLLSAHSSLRASELTLVPMKTTGDKILDRNLLEVGGKGLFTKELEEALLNGSIDIAVHSMKDMPAFMPGSLCFGAVLPREDPRDALISNHFHSIAELPQKAVIGTSSSRRQSQLLNLRPDLQIVPFRGNVNTRLKKLNENKVDATLLAVAGLKRINVFDSRCSIIPTEQMLPAVAQGAICVQLHQDNEYMMRILNSINHPQTEVCVRAERAFLTRLEASCATPIGALAVLKEDQIHLRAIIAKTSGSVIYKEEKSASYQDAEALGIEIAEKLLAKAGSGFFA
jgi:hydroxymethylbilane synthase